MVVCLLICTIGSLAQRPEDQVLAVYRQKEKAEQSGDANAWIALWSRESISEAEKMRTQIRPRPDLHYTSSRVYVQGDEAVLLGQYGKEAFLSMRFVREDGTWKIRDQVFSDQAYTAESVYAVLPPATGAFMRAGAPWQSVATAFNQADAARHGLQVRATFDESFLYIRIESSKPMPAPGSPAEVPPMGWPVMKIAVSGVGEFVLHATANIGDDETFGAGGRANSHRHYVAYWLELERANRMIFQTWVGLKPDPLIQTGGNFLNLRVPLLTMGIADARQTRIVIGDAQWPKSAMFSLEAQAFR